MGRGRLLTFDTTLLVDDCAVVREGRCTSTGILNKNRGNSSLYNSHGPLDPEPVTTRLEDDCARRIYLAGG